MMKKNLILVLMIILLSLNLISSSITKGNSSGFIEASYNPNKPILGWINISIINEPNTSKLDAFFNSSSIKNINIQELLNLNGLFNGGGYSCYPKDCSMNLTTKSDVISKTITINKSISQVYGIKITATDWVNDIKSIEFDISSNGGSSCSKPLKIDILDEGTFEYSSQTISEEICTIPKPYGCFDSSEEILSTELGIDDETGEPNSYCEEILVPPYKSYLVGADISTESSEFNKEVLISMNLPGCDEKSCTANISSSVLQCNITLNCELTSAAKATICIKPQVNTPYNIKYETGEPRCGYLNERANLKDFQIFAYPLKYGAVGNFRFNKTIAALEGITMEDLASSIENNLLSRYPTNGSNINCTKGCVVPIKFVSGIDNHEIIISNIRLGYTHGGGIKANATTIGEIVSMPPRISVINPSKLNLDLMNITTPSSVGNYIFSVKYGDMEIIKSNISVSDSIEAEIIPKEGFALINNSFFVLFEKPMNQSASYTWKFGNSTPITTSVPKVSYLFSSTENVLLTLIISTNKGNSTKIMNIPVYAPDYGFNMTVKKYREAISEFSSQLNDANQSVNAFAKEEIEKNLKIADLRDEINAKEKSYFLYLNSQETEKLRVMSDVLALKVPNKLILSQSIKNSKFLQTPERVNFDILEGFDAGTIEGDEDSFKKKINSWISENLDINFESKTYQVKYASGEKEILFSDLVFNINPKEDIDQLYFVIDSPSIADKIKISNSELKTKESSGNDAYLVDLKDLIKDANVRIEFLYPAEIDVRSIPVYVSPNLADIGGNIRINTGECDNDKKCDEGEDYKGCPGDCKPWGIAIILIIILLFIAVIIYIIMQEWYKRHYESYLFTNKTQLFNLINFMYTSSNQGNPKSEVFSKLKGQGWNSEQLDYAWKKFKGQRVGMWEIPVFKWVENKQVKNELIKRNPGMTKKSVIR